MIQHLKPYPAYKNSGVPWLGQVPAHWEVRAVRHVTRPVKGRQPKALYSEDEAPAGAQPYLTMEYLRRHKGTAKVYCALSDGLVTAAAGDVLLLWDGANAGEFFMAKDGVVSSTAALLSTDEHDRRYLYFMLKQCEPWLRALSTGMGIPHVDGRILKQMQICLPPHAEQAAIVRFLDWADRRIRRYIRAKQKLIKLLEEYRQALIHQAITGQIDVRTGKPYPAYKDSGVEWLGQVPEHWEVRKLRALFTKAGSGTTPSGEEFYGGDIPWVVTGDLNNSVLSNTTRTVNARALEDFSALRLYPKDSLIIAMYGATIGKTAILGIEACTNQACCVLAKPRKGVLVRFIQPAVISAKGYLVRQGYGGGQPNINSEIVHSLRIPVPPFEEQSAIVEYLDAQTAKIDTAIAAARSEIELLREYRTRLIADVVTGKMDVREVTAQLPEEPPEEEAELMDTDEIAKGEATDDDAAAEALSEEEVEP